MGFHTRQLPELEELKKIHAKFESDKEFLQYIQKGADALNGSSDSFRYLEEIQDKIKTTLMDSV